ncbi:MULTISPECIES: hypothetical protein [Thermoleptolyngbya]|uniref:hypothetical protein n=1 Tax=Thermoleptolyngbya TaxID=2303528 RepID=UPI00196624C1|nr:MULTISPECIES: hypothetical protein [Thermoleptolyngbya]
MRASVAVLPPVIDEGNFFPFKFWFRDSIQDGMYYRSELYYRLQTVDAQQRSRLYHFACRLAQREAVVVTANQRSCSLWINLRSSLARDDRAIAQLLDELAETLARPNYVPPSFNGRSPFEPE